MPFGIHAVLGLWTPFLGIMNFLHTFHLISAFPPFALLIPRRFIFRVAEFVYYSGQWCAICQSEASKECVGGYTPSIQKG